METRTTRPNTFASWLDLERLVDALFRDDWLMGWQLDVARADGFVSTTGGLEDDAAAHDAPAYDTPAYDASFDLQGDAA